MKKIEFLKKWDLEKVWDWGLAEKIAENFFNKGHEKIKHRKNVSNKKNIGARFLVRNIGGKVEKIYRGMKSTINLSMTRRTIASRRKNDHYNTNKIIWRRH